jgi:predicted nucleic acid-binding protein
LSWFVDTSAILAILDVDQPEAARASEIWRRIVGHDELAYTSNYVVLETISLLHARFGVSAVRRFLDEVHPAITVVWIGDEIHSRALRMVLAGSRRGPSLVDCTSFEIISVLGISRAFAFDRHFAERGYVGEAEN